MNREAPRRRPSPVEIAKRLTEGFGPQVRRLRRSRGMTQLALGNAAYLTVDHIGKIERGGTCPTVMTLGQIAAGLRVPVAHLFGPHGEVLNTDVPDPLGELVGFLRQRAPEDSALALSILRQVFDR